MKLQLKQRDSLELRCSFCHAIEGELSACSDCGARMHEECWEVMDKCCTSLGCANSELGDCAEDDEESPGAESTPLNEDSDLHDPAHIHPPDPGDVAMIRGQGGEEWWLGRILRQSMKKPARFRIEVALLMLGQIMIIAACAKIHRLFSWDTAICILIAILCFPVAGLFLSHHRIDRPD